MQEVLEQRFVLSNGQWIAVFDGMAAGETLEEQTQYGRELLYASNISEDDVRVVQAFDLSGTWLVQTPLETVKEAVAEQLQSVPGFVYVEDYEQAGSPEEQFVGRQTNPKQERSEALFGTFDYDAFVHQELAGEIPEQSGEVIPEPVDALTNNNGGSTGTSLFTQSETTLVAFGNTVVVGFNDSGSNAGGSNKFTGFARSTNGGATFTDGGTLPTNPNGDAGDPVLARNNSTGRLYFSTLQWSGSGIQMFRSDTNGASWMAPVQAAPGKTGFQDKQWHVVDNFAGPGNGNVYLVVRDFGAGNGIYFFRSTDHGATFGPTGGTFITSGSQGAYVAVGTDHSVYAFWWAGSTLQMRKSTNQGLSFGAPVTVASGLVGGTNGDLGLIGQNNGEGFTRTIRSNSFPHAAINPVNGHIYVTYNTNPAGVDKGDIFMVLSTNGGASWSAPVKVNDDPTTNDQWQPTLAVTPDGSKLGIFYYSRQDDLTTADGDPANNQFKYYGRIGAIAGSSVTFAASFAVSDAPSKPEVGRDGAVNTTYMGDYDTAVATADAFHVTWSDSRALLPGGGTRSDPSVFYERIAIGLSVTDTIPAANSVVTTPPLLFTVNVSEPLNPVSVDAGDLLINGVPAAAVNYTPGSTTLLFEYSTSPVIAEGIQTMHVDAGAFGRASDGNPVGLFDATFRYDATLLQVISTAPPTPGGVFTLPAPFTLDVTFNEQISPGSVQTSDLTLSGIAGATVTAVSVLPGETTARFTISGVTAEATLTASIAAGAITDTIGNPGGAFSSAYGVDIGTVPYPTPLLAKNPLGSLIYDPTTSGIINIPGDVDTFTLAIDPNQDVTILVTPIGTPATLQPSVTLRRPTTGNPILASATAAASGQRALLQTAAAADTGTYRIEISGAASTTGGYTVQVILNAALEREGNIVGVTNNTRPTAENIVNSFVTLSTPQATATRAAVLGGDVQAVPVVVSNYDFESGQQGWTVNNEILGPGPLAGLWHLSTRRDTTPNHTPVTSFYYGSETTGNYNTGARNSGAIVSPAFVVPTSASVSFKYFLDTQGGTTFDQARVQVSNNGGVTWTNVLGPLAESLSFTTASASLASFAGQTVQIRFFFDTMDAINNGFEGWYVDDVQITTPGTWNDYYSFTLTANDVVSVALEHQTGSGANVFLENSAGTVLASGVVGATNFDRAINNLLITAAGTQTYFLRVSGNLAATYAAVVTRNAAFDTEANDTFGTAQVINNVQGVLGHIGGASANTQTFNWVDSGWWNNTGFHDATNKNYLAGQSSNGFRDFFVFDLTTVTQAITGATLRLFNPSGGYSSPDPTETYTLFDVSTAIPTLRASGSGQVGIYNDLGSGTSFSSQVVSAANNNSIVSMTLNAAGLTALNAARGGLAALGGTLTTLAGTASQFIFGFSGNSADTRQLVLDLGAPEDWYSINVTSTSNILRLETSTPADGSGQFVNNLNPRIELYDPSGAPVAMGTPLTTNNRNEFIEYQPLVTGTYRVKVIAEGTTSGEYFLTKNFGPTITSLTVSPSIDEGNSAAITGSFTDLDSRDTHTVTVDWGPGIGRTTTVLGVGTRSFTLTRQYPDDNPSGTASDHYPITVVVSDNHGGADMVGASSGAVATALDGDIADADFNNATSSIFPTVTANYLSFATTGFAHLHGNPVTVFVDLHDPVAGWTNVYQQTITSGQLNFNGLAVPFQSQDVDQVRLRAEPNESPDQTFHLFGRLELAIGTPSLNVTVSNVAPVIASLNSGTINENDTFTLSGTFFDPGTQDTHTVVVDWGPGEGTTTLTTAGPNPPGTTLLALGSGRWSFSATHQYLDDNGSGTPSDIYPVSVTVTDDDGGISGGSDLVVTRLVGNATSAIDFDSATATFSAVTASQLSFATTGFGHSHGGTPGTVDLFVEVHNPDTDAWTEIYRQTLSSGGVLNFDGLVLTFPEQRIDQFRLNSVPGLNQTYHLWGPLAVTVPISVPSAVVTVNNVAPVVAPLNGPDAGAPASPGGPFSGVRGQALAFSATFTDVGTLDTHTATIDWGDGSTSPALVTEANGSGSITATHIYNAAGTYTITASVVDDDTGFKTVTGTVVIHALQLQTDCCDSNLTSLVIGGTTVGDQIVVSPGSVAGTVGVLLGGQSLGEFAPTGKIVVYGQAGDDNIQIAAAVLNQAWIYGDAGNDRIFAGNGPSLLFGGDGNDYLLGGGGRDVMVGGNGADQLIGNSSDDILIAGYTNYDGRSSAGHEKFWCDVLAEWNSTNTFAQRVQNLIDGTGGGTAKNNGSYLLPQVVDDLFSDDIDLLNGSSNEDWLIFVDGEDKVVGSIEATNDG